MDFLEKFIRLNTTGKELIIIRNLQNKLSSLEKRNFLRVSNDPNYRKLTKKVKELNEVNMQLLTKCVKYEDTITDLYNEVLTLKRTCGKTPNKLS